MASILKGQSGQPIGFEVKPQVNGDAVATEFDAGVGRTWQNVTASRSAGVTYTNNTGRDIDVIANVPAGATSGRILTVNTVEFFAQTVSGAITPLYVTVSEGSTYSINGSFERWMELR